MKARSDATAAGAGVPGQGELQPLRHPVALHQDLFVLKRFERMAGHPGEHQVAQRFRVIAMNHHEARGEGIGHVVQLLVFGGYAMSVSVLILTRKPMSHQLQDRGDATFDGQVG